MDRKTTALNQLNLGTNEPGGAAASKESLRELICAATVKECTRQLDGRLSAIVLTGSLARDEASFARLGEGWELYGDAEFLVVMKDGCNPPSGEHKAQIRAAIEESLAGARMKGAVELGFVSPVFFSRLPEHIFSYELKHLGRVVWGETEILETIPDFATSHVSREDAWRLLSNRLVELLGCASDMTDGSTLPSPSLQYRLVKLHLDTATAISVFLNRYQPTYRARMDALADAAVERHGEKLPFDVLAFNNRLKLCTAAKLSFPANFEPCSRIDWRDSVQSALAIWCWMLAELCSAPATLTIDELFEKYRRRQPYRARIRGWLYTARACGWHRALWLWPHWVRMCWVMSPRYWIYSVGVSALRAAAIPTVETAGPDAAELFELLRRKLPVVNGPHVEIGQMDFLSLAAGVVWNYKQFVVGTRA